MGNGEAIERGGLAPLVGARGHRGENPVGGPGEELRPACGGGDGEPAGGEATARGGGGDAGVRVLAATDPANPFGAALDWPAGIDSHLRYFANNNERVTTVMLPGERTFLQSIGDASVQTGYYTVIDQEGQQSDAAEQALALVEAHAAAAWREVAAGVWPLPDEHRASLAAWVALQLLRGTSVRNSMSELASHALLLEVILGGRARLRAALIAAGEPIDDHTVNQEWVGLFENPLRAEARAEHHMQHLADLLPRVTQSLFDRSWLLTVY